MRNNTFLKIITSLFGNDNNHMYPNTNCLIILLPPIFQRTFIAFAVTDADNSIVCCYLYSQSSLLLHLLFVILFFLFACLQMLIHLSSPDLRRKSCVFPAVETKFLNIVCNMFRLWIVFDSNTGYEVVVIKHSLKHTLDIYMDTHPPLLKICCNPTKEALMIIWYLLAMFRKDVKITCKRFVCLICL